MANNGPIQLIAIGLGLVTTFCACASAKTPAGKTAMESVIASAATAASLYSFSYLNGRRILHVHVPAYAPPVTCASLAASKGDDYWDIWYLDIFVDWEEPVAKAAIGTAFPPTADSGAPAYVEVVHAQSSALSKWVVSSSMGTIEFASAPQAESEQIQDIAVRGHLDFSFPREPRAASSCQVEISLADGGDVQEKQTCTCVDSSGSASTCASEKAGTCCTPLTDEVDSFSLDIIADSCGVLCLATAGDPNSCSELNGGIPSSSLPFGADPALRGVASLRTQTF